MRSRALGAPAAFAPSPLQPVPVSRTPQNYARFRDDMSLREPRLQSQGRPTAKPSWATSPETETAVAIFRTVFVIGAVVALWVHGEVTDFTNPAYLVSVLAGIYNVTLVTVLTLRRPRRAFSNQVRQFTLTLDVVFVTLWVAFGGTIGRAFFPLYFPLVVIAAVWFEMIGAALTAAASSALYVIVAIAILPHLRSPLGARPTSPEALLARVVFLFVVALLVGYIVDAQKREHDRIDRRRSLDDLLRHQQLMQEFHALVTPSISPPPGLDVGVGFREAMQRGAGDYYDLLALDEGRHGLCVADVAGKHESGALRVPILRYALRAAASIDTRPARIMERVNELVFDELQPDRFATMFYAQIDHWAGEVTYVNAGHDPALLIREDGTVQTLDIGGLILGVLRAARYDEGLVRMGPQDTLVLYTDGALEARNADGEQFGSERFVTAAKAAVGGLASAAEAANDILKTIKQFAGLKDERSAEDSSTGDDITIMVARIAPRPALAGQPTADAELPGQEEAAPGEVAG